MFEFRLPGSLAHSWTGDLLTIGRDASNTWVLVAPGVWARHAEIRRDQTGRLSLRPVGDSIVSVNGKPVREATLHWGDTVGLGSTVVRFHLSAPVQFGLKGWERSLWILLFLCVVGQILLVLALRP